MSDSSRSLGWHNPQHHGTSSTSGGAYPISTLPLCTQPSPQISMQATTQLQWNPGYQAPQQQQQQRHQSLSTELQDQKVRQLRQQQQQQHSVQQGKVQLQPMQPMQQIPDYAKQPNVVVRALPAVGSHLWNSPKAATVVSPFPTFGGQSNCTSSIPQSQVVKRENLLHGVATSTYQANARSTQQTDFLLPLTAANYRAPATYALDTSGSSTQQPTISPTNALRQSGSYCEYSPQAEAILSSNATDPLSVAMASKPVEVPHSPDEQGQGQKWANSFMPAATLAAAALAAPSSHFYGHDGSTAMLSTCRQTNILTPSSSLPSVDLHHSSTAIAGAQPSATSLSPQGSLRTSPDDPLHARSSAPSLRLHNVNRERTRPLRQWLLDHHDVPYPTRQQKQALAKSANMPFDKVAMWFANTRRQIRKVTMETWSGGLFNNKLPKRVGNGAIFPASDSDSCDESDETNPTWLQTSHSL